MNARFPAWSPCAACVAGSCVAGEGNPGAAPGSAPTPARAPPLLVRQQGGVLALAEVDGAVSGDDPRLSALRARLPANRPRPLGFYATPIEGAAAPHDGGE